MYAEAAEPNTDQRDRTPDFNDFEGGRSQVPNGAVQIHLQTVYGGTQQPLHRQLGNQGTAHSEDQPESAEVARLDGKSGFSQRFGSPFHRNFDGLINVGGVDYDPPVTDQLQRFDQNGFLTNNAFRINTDDSDAIGGFGVFQSGVSTVFDGTTASTRDSCQADCAACWTGSERPGRHQGPRRQWHRRRRRFRRRRVSFQRRAQSVQRRRDDDDSAFRLPRPRSSRPRNSPRRATACSPNFNLYYLGMLTESRCRSG